MSRRISTLATTLLLSTHALALGSPPASLAAQEAEGRRLGLADYLDLETVSDPQISPDGDRIVYTRGWIDKTNDRRESSLWVMGSDGSRNRHLTEGSGSPVVTGWDPDPVHPGRRRQRFTDLRALDGRRGR